MADLRALAVAATPGPWRVEGPREQGGAFIVWGKQGTPPDFSDGWAIPLVARGVSSNMTYIAALDPQTVIALLDRAEAAERERDAAVGALRALTEIDQRTPVGNCIVLINTALAAPEEP